MSSPATRAIAERLLAEGASAVEVAEELDVKPGTVRQWKRRAAIRIRAAYPAELPADSELGPLPGTVFDPMARATRIAYLDDRVSALASLVSIARRDQKARQLIDLIRVEQQLHAELSELLSAQPPPVDARSDSEVIAAMVEAIRSWPEHLIADFVEDLEARHKGE